jgi:hypothetical protein
MGALEVAYSARLVVVVAMCAGVRRVDECEAAMSMELTNTLASDGAEGSAPVVRRDPQWVETVLTVMVTSVVVIMVSILAVAMNLI